MDDWIQLVGILWWPIGIILSAWLSTLFAQRPLRNTVRHLLAQNPISSSEKWPWSAPESYALICGPENAKHDVFKLGLLQLIAMRVFVPEYIQASEHENRWETVLRRGPTSSDRLDRSLAAIYRLWESSCDPRTVGQVVKQAEEKYGSLAGFADREVIPLLAYTELRSKQDELESRMADILRRMQKQRSRYVKRNPRQALMAAAVAVAVGRPASLGADEMQLVTQQSEQADTKAAVSEENTTSDICWPIWLDLLTSQIFERTFAAVDSECQVSGGEGGDGCDSWDVGDGADCGDFGG